MILLLLASGVVSVCMKQFDDAVSITVVSIIQLTDEQFLTIIMMIIVHGT